MKLFISYSRDDAGNFAKHIHRYLRDKGYAVFIDVNNITIGDPWARSIEKNISECDIFVVILTPDSLTSSHVEREVLQAQRENKIIVPCIHEYVMYNEIKWGLDKIQAIEFSNEYQLVLNLYPKIKNYEKDKKPIDGVSESFSKTIEEKAKTAISTPIKSDADKLQENKDALQTPIGTTGAIGGSGIYSPKNTVSESYNKERKYTELDSRSNQPRRINLKIIIVPIIAVAIIGVIVSINYFSGLAPSGDDIETLTAPPSNNTNTVTTTSPHQNEEVTRTNTPPLIDNGNNFLEYVNNIYGIRIQYPSTWLKMEDISLGNFTGMTLYDIVVFAPIQETAVTKLWIGMNKLPNPNIYLNEYHDLIRTGLSYGDPNFKVIEETIDVTLSSNPAYRLEYIYSREYDGEIETYQGLNIGTVIGDYAYFLMFETPMEKYSQHFPTVQQMINSFKITSNN